METINNLTEIQEQQTIKAKILNPKKKDIPDGVWAKCPECNEIIYNGELDRNLRICHRCSYYFSMDPHTRIAFLADEGSFHRYKNIACSDTESCDRMIMSGKARLSNHQLVILALNIFSQPDIYDTSVIEYIISTVNYAIEEKLPLLAIYTIEDGTHGEECFIGQRLNITAMMSKLSKESLPYISVFSQATSNSNFPSFAYLADIIIAESQIPGTSNTGSRIGRRESESAIRLLFQNGIVDMIVPREDLKGKITDTFNFFS